MAEYALFSLKGQTVLVTGASSGIGLHIARVAAAAGAMVALAARRTELIASAAEQLRASGHRAQAFALDVTQSSEIPGVFDAVEEELGAPVDILLNNAGIMLDEKFVSQSEADIDRLFDTNLKGAFLVAQEAARRMSRIKRGSIINVASTAGLRAGAFMASYGASKAALIHLSRTMALELAGKGIRVNALCPGNIETDIQIPLASFAEPMIQRTPMRRFGKLEDLDGPFLLLASDAGRYMTGSVLTVDGGQTLSWM